MTERPNELDFGLSDVGGKTPLERTIDKIGMGTYQWTLLSLCGFGWMADNMWIQTVAIVLPRVQQHYSISDNFIGALSSSMFAGMMLGAIGWGTCSDLLGRSMAFNATLLFTSVFGLMSAITTTFPSLCITLFFLGTAVGGSMPTDGTLLLEQLPNGKRYLVTALSIFFSFGAVFAAVAAIIVVPSNTCFASETHPCDMANENRGWKYLLIVLGLMTLVMTILRVLFFRLYESPRFLVATGRPKEAVENLQLISKFNGDELNLTLRDVRDHFGIVRHRSTSVATVDEGEFSAFVQQGDVERLPLNPDAQDTESTRISSISLGSGAYSATGESNNPLESHSFATPAVEERELLFPTLIPENDEDDQKQQQPQRIRPRRRRSSVYRVSALLPSFFRKPLWAWFDRLSEVLSPEWLWTTLMTWAIWFSMALAYTMFNVFLPKLIETRLGRMFPNDPAANQPSQSSLADSLWNVVIYSVGGCPGAIIGAYLVESRLGRRWSLALSTFVTAFFCIVFIRVNGPLSLKASTVGVSLSANIMWAILYGWTPVVFATNVRGTACGIASSLSRVGGMIAPILGGWLLTIDVSFPVYTSVVTFTIVGICVLLLKEHERGEIEEVNGRAFVH